MKMQVLGQVMPSQPLCMEMPHLLNQDRQNVGVVKNHSMESLQPYPEPDHNTFPICPFLVLEQEIILELPVL